MLIKGNRIVILTSVWNKILEAIYNRHQGIMKCRDHARSSVQLLGINRDIMKRAPCEENGRKKSKDPLSLTPLLEHPFQMVGADLCEVKCRSYLILLDHFSRYLEIAWLTNINIASVIGSLKNISTWHGLPNWQWLTVFVNWLHTHHKYSILSRANGRAKRAVQTVKCILQQRDLFWGFTYTAVQPWPGADW